jgi:hypothetical protein
MPMRWKSGAVPIALALVIGCAAVVVGAPREAHAQYVAPPPPPSAYIATTQPEYYEGRPVYFYNGNWYYRDDHGWNYYRSEPAYLRDRRAHWNDNDRRYHYHR